MPSSTWQHELANVITDPRELLELLELDSDLLPKAIETAKQFALRVPRGFITRMRKNDPTDPLLKQVLPLGAELEKISGFSEDPLQEKNTNPISGLLHKYEGRVLLTPTSACAIHCRYCFRRYFPYSENTPNTKEWDKTIDYIAKDKTLEEVILSGGDPLTLNDNYLDKLIQKIASIPHVKTLRIHTRLLIVLPSRVTSELIELLTNLSLNIVIVVHSNHANEIDENVCNALESLRKTKIVLLNQTVLLKGVNDSAESLIELNKKLFDCGVLPYYLHLLDKVQGTAHFDVNENIAKEIIKNIREKLPGYLVPKLVREIAGEKYKTEIL